MPAMPLMRVVLPAPLSPTRAVTLPGVTSKETFCRTCTGPKLLLIPLRLSSGPVEAVTGTASVVVVDTAMHPFSATSPRSVAAGQGFSGGRSGLQGGPAPRRAGPTLSSLDAVLGA